jgi:hypothetical protein
MSDMGILRQVTICYWAPVPIVRQLSVMKYHEIFPMARPELEVLLESGNESEIIEALLSAAYHDPDWRWVQGVCLRFLDHSDVAVRSNAATCLGHIARIHKTLDLELVLPKLLPLKGDAAIRPWVEDALEDIRFFVRVQ